MSHPSYQKTLEDALHQIEGINQEIQEMRNHRVTDLESIGSTWEQGNGRLWEVGL